MATKTATKTKSKKSTNVSLKMPVYDTNGKEVRTIDLPETLFDVDRNDELVRQVVLGMEANARTPVAHTKGRGEVRGGGRKPWKQKGTGRARHGSRRSPIWRGGGVTFGPRNEKDYSQQLNKKMRTKALAVVLSQKLRDGEVLFVDSLNIQEPKTKDAKAALTGFAKVAGFEGLATRKNNAAFIALGENSAAVKRSFNNMGNVLVGESRNLNPVEVLSFQYLIIENPEVAVEELTKRMK